jgi:hypothetical protein
MGYKFAGFDVVGCNEIDQRFAALCLFAPCTMLQITTNVDGANSTKPLLYAGAVI